MMPIPFLSPAPPNASPGVTPAIMPAGTGFAALLPGGVAPVQPRQRDAEGGKALPASDEGEDEVDPTAWVAPLLWQAVCPPVDAVKGEGGAGIARADAGQSAPLAHATAVPRTIVALPAPGPAAAAAPIEGAPVSSPAAVTGPFPGEGRRPAASGPLLDPGLRRGTALERPVDMPAAVNDVLGLSRPPATAPTAPVPQAAAPLETIAAEPTKKSPATAAEIAPPAPRPTPAELQPARIAPASQMFAAAIQRAVRDERRPATSEATPSLLTPTIDLATRTITADTIRPAPLDLARETWPTKMIERIEQLRDAVDAADTSIRLIPDKLGTIDVSLRRDGDAVHVQFTAQAAETRQLLAEAQPKLAELAEAKGLRLSMQSGDGGGQPYQQQRAAASAPSIIAPRVSSEDEDTAADERVA